jgi:hypothetical protein
MHRKLPATVVESPFIKSTKCTDTVCINPDRIVN